ncbi:MAG: CRISPR-associated helicase Cas3', partial [Endomicrobiaceae bacterium]|nr:CRISPR-associated helicase Cas3' [Endomicrobiaceae bacterium]
HSTSSAKFIYENFHTGNNKDVIQLLTSELISLAISSHHGLYDCIDTNGNNQFNRKMEKKRGIQENNRYMQSEEELEEALKDHDIDSDKVNTLFNKSLKEIKDIINNIKSFDDSNGNFYLGMLERLILSTVIDSDRTDTVCFMDNKETPEIKDNTNLFKELLENLNKNLSNLKTDDKISKVRQEISDICFNFAEKETGIYRLVIPTGSGKTLSALRYALRHVHKYSKQHIFYIAPYMSILEQNSSEIRKFISRDDALLEHHSNIVLDDDDENNEKYKLLTGNWNSPIVATTMVQILNTLFSHKTSCMRRMHSLTNSVIIIDEIQSLPVKCVSLFNLACNFLSKVCNTTIVLCSATQPTLDEVKYKIILPQYPNIVEDEQILKYSDVFKRTKIVSKITSSGYLFSEIAEFVTDKIRDMKSLLMVVNTKKSAEKIYKEIINKNKDTNIQIVHLSTNMCPAHRKETIDLLRKKLTKQEQIICISTQLIEAGVDISFECVIRSIAGLDNIAQSAGRCNRNGEYKECKNVYIVNLKEENLQGLEYIQSSQNATYQLLTKLKQYQELINSDLLSQNVMREYYKYFLEHQNKDFAIKELDTNIVSLLSNNAKFVQECREAPQIIMKQSFKTAGENFTVIDDYKTDVVVYYDKNSEDLILELTSDISYEEKIKYLKKLQPYTVGLTKTQFKTLQSHIDLLDIGIQVLKKEFYNEQIGVCCEPNKMEPLIK